MPNASALYAMGRISVLETRLLTKDKLARIMETHRLEDTVKVLQEMGMGSGAALASNVDFETLLRQETQNTRALIASMTPDAALSDLFYLPYDINNLKVLFKGEITGGDVKHLLSPLGVIDIDLAKSAVAGEDPQGVPAALKEACARVRSMLEEPEAQADPQAIEVLLDQAYFTHALQVAASRRSGFMRDYLTAQIDLANIETMLRMKLRGQDARALARVLLTGGSLEHGMILACLPLRRREIVARFAGTPYKSVVEKGIAALRADGHLTRFECEKDNYLLDVARTQRDQIKGLSPLFGYMLAKDNEARILRQVCLAKANGIPNDKLRERLRDLYG
nr:V-type ATPase subunit [Maliibacterium massiliense]